MSNVEANRGPVLWRERLPWLIIVRAFRPAVSARMLLFAAAGLVVMIAGWRMCWLMFANSPDPLIAGIKKNSAATEIYETEKGERQIVWPAWPWEKIPYRYLGREREGVIDNALGDTDHRIFGFDGGAVTGRVWQITLPFQFIFYGEIGWTGLAFCLLCGLWSLAVWALFGGAMTRSVAMQLTRQETIPWGQARNFAMRHWLSYFTAPLYPLLGVFLLAIPVAFLGLIAQIDIGALLAAVLWPLALLAGLLMAMLLLGLFFGWPLMWGTVSVEANDAFDALSRSYAYVYQRPLNYLFYALVAAVIGVLGYLLVGYFAEGVIHLTNWAASWGAGNSRTEMLTKMAIESGPGYYAVLLIALWTALVRLIAAGFAISYLWSAATAIYLLLRRDVDSAEMDEIQLEQEEQFGLPPLTTDEQGVPGVADAPPPAPAPTDKPVSEEE